MCAKPFTKAVCSSLAGGGQSMQRWRHSVDVVFCTGFVHSSIVGAAAEAAAVMPDSGRVSIAPLVASGTDSRSSKVRGPNA